MQIKVPMIGFHAAQEVRSKLTYRALVIEGAVGAVAPTDFWKL